jgi:diguanylate cyclase (GGDEF)-like protein
MIQCFSLAPADLSRFLERHKAAFTLRNQIDLDIVLKQILEKANEFVPSESGSILLDDPYRKSPERKANELVFIAAFGKGSNELLGKRLSASKGIAGRVYQTGTPYLSQNVDDDQYFFAEIDAALGFRSHSIVAVPIYIGKTACGVLELVNRSEKKVFSERDMTLLEIFAGYTSFTLQGALDAKRAHELAKRDDLTGLFNDRWFHVCLAEALKEAEATQRECTLMFMDLDHFKAINDQYGHLAGSQVLREVGFLIGRLVDNEGAIVSRYGGDEFVMILPGTSIEESLAVAETVRMSIASTTFIEREYGFGMPPLNLKENLSASIGIASYRPGTTQSGLENARNDLLRKADAAMYEAKSRGKNCVVVYADEFDMQKSCTFDKASF